MAVYLWNNWQGIMTVEQANTMAQMKMQQIRPKYDGNNGTAATTRLPVRNSSSSMLKAEQDSGRCTVSCNQRGTGDILRTIYGNM